MHTEYNRNSNKKINKIKTVEKNGVAFKNDFNYSTGK